MQISIEECEQVKLIRLTGRLDAATMQLVEDEFLGLIEQGIRLFLFDLRELHYISSAGLRVMLLSVKKTRAAGGKIALFGLQDNVHEVFQISGFTSIFSIFQTEEEALQYINTSS
jgi:anti-sigma B factor antagonist